MLENQLINKCKMGDGEAFRKLISTYRAKLFSYLWRFANSRDIAEELVQETLIKVWRGFKKYDEQKKFSSWLFTIAHNTAMDSLRDKKRSKIFTSIEEVDDMRFPSRPDEDIIKQENLDLINESIDALSEKQKKVFLLRQYGELTFREISKTMNEPLNTVISHMHYAVKKIKKQIEFKNESKYQSTS